MRKITHIILIYFACHVAFKSAVFLMVQSQKQFISCEIDLSESEAPEEDSKEDIKEIELFEDNATIDSQALIVENAKTNSFHSYSVSWRFNPYSEICSPPPEVILATRFI